MPSSMYSTYFLPKHAISKISGATGGQKNVYYINNPNHQTLCASSSNSLLFRSVFLRYLKKRRPLLVILLCVILMSLSYLFSVSGGVQFKRHKIVETDMLQNPERFSEDEILDKEEISIQYSKLTRLNKKIQKVISIGKVSLLNGDENLSKSGLSKTDSTADQSYSENRLNDRYISRKRHGKEINAAISSNIIEADNTFNKEGMNLKVPTKLSKLNYDDESSHSDQ